MSYLIKVGGSLIPSFVSKLYQTLKRITPKPSQKIFLFPGGGKFADQIREYRDSLHLSEQTTHKMALACLDQNAYLISNICKCKSVSTLQEITRVQEFPAVIAPYRLMMKHWPFSGYNLNIDTLSSDSSALYVAYLLKAKLIIATDVDGVFKRDPKKTKIRPELFREIDSRILKKIKGGGPLDATLAQLIDKYEITTWVVNGKYPARIAQIVKNQKLIKGTLIKP